MFTEPNFIISVRSEILLHLQSSYWHKRKLYFSSKISTHTRLQYNIATQQQPAEERIEIYKGCLKLLSSKNQYYELFNIALSTLLLNFVLHCIKKTWNFFFKKEVEANEPHPSNCGGHFENFATEKLILFIIITKGIMLKYSFFTVSWGTPQYSMYTQGGEREREGGG